MSTRLRKLVAAAGVATLFALLGYVPSAYSAIGASNAPITTSRVDLRSATYRSVPNNLQVCFDQAVGAIVPGGEALFSLEGYDASGRLFTFPPGGGTLDANPNCILLPINPLTTGPSSIADMTILRVNGPGAVTGAPAVGSPLNTPGAVALGGNLAATLDRTDALELQSATPIPSAVPSVDFTFERTPDDDSLEQDPGDYGYQTAAGDAGTCIATGGITYFGNTVRVAGPWVFDPDTGTLPGACGNPNQAVRFFVNTTAAPAGAPATCTTDAAAMDRGSIRAVGNDVNAKFNPLGVFIPAGATGTDDPDLTGAVKSGANTLDATFDETLRNAGPGAPVAGCFLGFEGDGDVHYGDTAVITNPGGASNMVRVTFNNLPSNQLQIFGTLPGGVTSSQTAGEPNSYGIQEFVGERVLPGFSDAGDLEQVTTNAAAERATFCFDTDESVGPVVPPLFQIMDNSGGTNPGIGPAGVAGNCATIQFAPGVVSNPLAVAGGILAAGIASTDSVGTPDVANGPVLEVVGNRVVGLAHVALNGPAPTAGLPPGPVALPALPAPPGGGGTGGSGASGAGGSPAAPPGPRPVIVLGAELNLCAARATAATGEILIGDNQGNKICGYGGDDIIRGKGGPDDLRGGDGADVLIGGLDRDVLLGGAGNDSLRGKRGADLLKGGRHSDTALGGKDNDMCRAEVVRQCEV